MDSWEGGLEAEVTDDDIDEEVADSFEMAEACVALRDAFRFAVDIARLVRRSMYKDQSLATFEPHGFPSHFYDEEEERLAWQVTTRVTNLEQQPWALHLLYPDWTVPRNSYAESSGGASAHA